MGGAAYDRGLALLAAKPQEPNPYLDRALRRFKAATALDPGNAHAWRMLGQLYITLGQNEPARQALSRAVQLRPNQPLYWEYLGDSYDGLGMSQEALQAWKEGRAGLQRQDQIAVNYIKLADAHIQAGDPLSAIPTLRDDVLRADPDNLFALATIVTTYDRAVGGKHPLADPYRQAIQFPSRACLRCGDDPRYADYSARAAFDLYSSGYWDAALVQRVGQYWSAEGCPAGLLLARRLSQSQPQELRWRELLAQALAQAGQPAEAVLVAEGGGDSSSPASLRLRALVLRVLARHTSASEDWQRVAEAFLAYHQAAPEDLLPLAGLSEAYDRLGQTAAAEQWRASYRVATQGADLQAAAQALALPADAVALGPNLAVNGSFESWKDGLPDAWVWSDMATGHPWNEGLFVGVPDEWSGLEGTSAADLCLWRKEDPNLEPARAGFWQVNPQTKALAEIHLQPGATYVISFDYATTDTGDGGPTLYLCGQNCRCWAGDREFPATQGQWRHIALACGPAEAGDGPLQPLLRLFRPGSVLFDNFAVRQATGVQR